LAVTDYNEPVRHRTARTNVGEDAFNAFGGPQVLPMLSGEVVEGQQ
jgi:hypothetical protein